MAKAKNRGLNVLFAMILSVVMIMAVLPLTAKNAYAGGTDFEITVMYQYPDGKGPIYKEIFNEVKSGAMKMPTIYGGAFGSAGKQVPSTTIYGDYYPAITEWFLPSNGAMVGAFYTHALMNDADIESHYISGDVYNKWYFNEWILKGKANGTYYVKPDELSYPEGYVFDASRCKTKYPQAVIDSAFLKTVSDGLKTVDAGLASGNFTLDIVVPIKKGSSQQGTNGAFTDVSTSHWSYPAIKWAVDNKITSGTSATKFSPNATCTRAQIVTFLYRAAGSPDVTVTNKFTDMPSNDTFKKAISWAVQKGITNGKTATTFAPNDPCTRAQIVTFLYKASEHVDNATYFNIFTDVPDTAYYIKPVGWALQNNITSGTTPTTFSPNAPCTRAQAVTFLYRSSQK